MTVDTLNSLSLTAFFTSGVVFLIAVALFFLMDIPKVVGELSGSTAKKSIQKIQEHNASNTGNLVHSPKPNSHVTKPSKTGRVGVGTEKFPTSALASQNSETTVLVNNETTILTNNSETTLLVNNSAPVAAPSEASVPSSDVASTQVQTVIPAECEIIESLSFYMENELIE